MKDALTNWMMVAITVLVVVALVWTAMVNKIEDKQSDLDQSIETNFTIPNVTGSCTGC